MKHKIPLSLYIACLCTSIALIYAMRTILFLPNNQIITSVDGMGYSTIIINAAENIKNLHFSSWFPNWFNGSSLWQYFPPLSYLAAALIQVFTNNITLTLKIFIFGSLFIGSVGVWYFGYIFVDRKFSFIGSILYSVNPFLLSALLKSGIYSQGFVFSLTPWFVLLIFLFYKKKTRFLWAVNVLSAALLLLSSISYSIMTFFCIAVCSLVLLLIKKISLSDFVLWISSAFLGILLVSFWILPGATRLDNPMIKYFLNGDTINWTANESWFNWYARKFTPKFFPFSYIIVTVISFLCSVAQYVKKTSKMSLLPVIFVTMLSAVSVVCSFGLKIIPFNKNIIPGRILALTAFCGSILCVYAISVFYTFKKRIIRFSSVLLLCTLLVSEVFPFEEYHADTLSEMKNFLETIPDTNKGFEKGRFSWISNVNSDVSYLSYICGLNSPDGWNVEGNKHSRSVSNYNIALSANCEQYVVKHLLNSNVRSVLISEDYAPLIENLADFGFENIAQLKNNLLLYNSKASSYFIKNKRNTIFIGKTQGLNFNFPWIVEGKSPNLTEYSIDEIEDYDIIYLCEPEIENEYHLKVIETMLRTLAQMRKTIIIEQGRAQRWSVLGVSPSYFNAAPNSVITAEPSVGNNYCRELKITEQTESTALLGLDNAFYKMHIQNSNMDLPIIGTKNIEGSDVYFVGMSLSQMLYSSIINAAGQNDNLKNSLSERDKKIESMLLSVIDKGNPFKSIDTEEFVIESGGWDYSGGKFTYSSNSDENVVISIAYSPHWKIKVDGTKVSVKQFENLMLVSLPSGEHSITLKYTSTPVGDIAWSLSAIGFLAFILLLLIYNKIKNSSDKLTENFIEYMSK